MNGVTPIPGRFVESAEEIIALVWNGHSAFIWVNGAEGEIFSRSLALCQHVEKRRLPENENSCEADPSGHDGVIVRRRGYFSNPAPSSTQTKKVSQSRIFGHLNQKHFAQLQGQIIP